MKVNTVGLLYGAAGSAAVAARSLGLDVVFNFETRGDHFINTFKLNFKNEHNVLASDDFRSVLSHHHHFPADIIIGQPDCKAFSTLRTRKKEEVSIKDTDLFGFVYEMRSFKPKIFIVENLEKGMDALKEYIDGPSMIEPDLTIGDDHITDLYRLIWITINANAFVPQNRKRTFLIGLDKDWFPTVERFRINPPESLCAKNVKDLLKDLEQPNSSKFIDNHHPANHTKEREIGFRNLKYGQSFYGTQNNRKLDPQRYGYTVTSHCTQHVHYKFPRVLTARENARIMGWPDSFIFTGGRTVQLDSVGKAVVPQVIEYILKTIMNHLSRN